MERVGYQTSKNRVSMGLALTVERMTKLRRMAVAAGVSVAEKVGQLVDDAPEPDETDKEQAA